MWYNKIRRCNGNIVNKHLAKLKFINKNSSKLPDANKTPEMLWNVDARKSELRNPNFQFNVLQVIKKREEI